MCFCVLKLGKVLAFCACMFFACAFTMSPRLEPSSFGFAQLDNSVNHSLIKLPENEIRVSLQKCGVFPDKCKQILLSFETNKAYNQMSISILWLQFLKSTCGLANSLTVVSSAAILFYPCSCEYLIEVKKEICLNRACLAITRMSRGCLVLRAVNPHSL